MPPVPARKAEPLFERTSQQPIVEEQLSWCLTVLDELKLHQAAAYVDMALNVLRGWH